MADKLKSIVALNAEGADVDLELTSEQAVVLLEKLYSGESIYISLTTPVANGHVKDNPLAYAS